MVPESIVVSVKYYVSVKALTVYLKYRLTKSPVKR